MMSDSGNGGCWSPFLLFSTIIGGLLFGMLFLLPGEASVSSSVPGSAGASAVVVPDLVEPTLELVLVYADTEISAEAMQATQATLRARINALAGSQQIGPLVRIVEGIDQQITVQFSEAGMEAQAVIAALTAPGYLELVDFTAVPSGALTGYVGQRIQTTAGQARAGTAAAGEVFTTLLTHEDIVTAQAQTDNLSGWWIEVGFTVEAGERLGAFSAANIGGALAIVLDGVVLSAPVLRSQVTTPVVITGNFSEAEAQALAAQLSSQPLPVTLRVESLSTLD